MFRRIDIRTATFSPAAVGTGETRALFTVMPGERVVWASAQRLVSADAASTSTFDLGDGTAAGGFIAAMDTEGAAGSLVNGGGTFLANSGGKLYDVADTIDVTYTPGATPGATVPSACFTVAVVREYP